MRSIVKLDNGDESSDEASRNSSRNNSNEDNADDTHELLPASILYVDSGITYPKYYDEPYFAEVEELLGTTSTPAPCTLVWRDLTVHIKLKNGKLKRLVNNVNGIAKPGTLVALMGPSGAGKTTLMSALAHRSPDDTIVDGAIAMNGLPIADFMHKESGYMHQDELFVENLTVMEHLSIMARLRMDRRTSPLVRKRRVNQLLRQLSLYGARHTRIGGLDGQKTLSGGERKRLAFATELLTDPGLLFCDEPTTGLDSSSAQKLITLLRASAVQGKTIICTIHQPSSELMALFDKLVLLAEGRVAFAGNASAALNFFESLGYQCPITYNPTDYFIKVLALTPGSAAKVLVLAGGGALCCGATLEEAFFQAKNLHAACEVQLRLASLPQDDLLLIDEDTRKQMYESSRKPPADASKWRVGGEEFEALMRMMDNAGFRTGHVYRHPLVKNDVPKPRSDVEVPPAVSSLGYLLEEEELYKQGLWKKGGKSGERTRWLNSPNVYQKVELLETGTSDPKRITKWVDANNEEWVQEGSPAHSTPVKIDTLQFVPKNTNPKEFKQLQQQIKDNRRADKISAGPQSHILEGVARDEARLLPEDAAGTHTGDHVILMGAASKGIIQRGYQHNATMYSAPYARNPFDHVTDTDIDEYRRVVERKQRGHDYDTDISESEALSAPPRSAPDTEDESREEQRVLRIETKQVPVMSQPEVVLSDADPTDFLNAERDHADRTRGEHTLNGDHSDAQQSTFSHSSKEGSPSKEVSTEDSPKKDKKKKKGLRTPSFLKKKKEKKKEKSSTPQPA